MPGDHLQKKAILERLKEAYQTGRVLEVDYNEKWKPTKISTKNPLASAFVEEEMERIFREEEEARKRTKETAPHLTAKQLEAIKKHLEKPVSPESSSTQDRRGEDRVATLTAETQNHLQPHQYSRKWLRRHQKMTRLISERIFSKITMMKHIFRVRSVSQRAGIHRQETLSRAVHFMLQFKDQSGLRHMDH